MRGTSPFRRSRNKVPGEWRSCRSPAHARAFKGRHIRQQGERRAHERQRHRGSGPFSQAHIQIQQRLYAQMRKQRGMTQAEVARAMGVSQARVSRMEHGDIERMQVESIAAYVAAIGGHLRLVADFDQATTTFVDYTDALTA